MKLSIGFSSCPNDTFIFDALIHQKIETKGIQFEPVLEDIETLNQWALKGKLDITKLSFPAFFQSSDTYVLLHSGGAMGMGVGPLLVGNENKPYTPSDIQNCMIALPGKNTTANFLFSYAYPEAANKIFMRFDKIESFVVSHSGLSSQENQILGVIIHENRFTYRQKGLYKIADLGEIWETKMKLPIPLAGIAIKKSFSKAVCLQVDALIKQSVEYALRNYPSISSFVKHYAQTMNEEVMRKHIELYVNKYSLNMGEEGKNAIRVFYEIFSKTNHVATEGKELFL